MAAASYGLKCRSEDEKNNDEFAEIAKMCLSNVSNWDSPSNRDDNNNGRRNDNRHYSNSDSYDGNRDSRHDRNNRDYNNYDGGNGNSYGLWRRQQNSGGYGYSDEYSDFQQNPYYNPRSGIRSRGNQDRNNQRKNNNSSDNKKNNSTNSTLEVDGSSLEKVEACIIHCIFQEMNMLDDTAYPDKSMVTKVMTKKIRDPKVKDFIEESIDDCFELLETDNKRSNCDYSKNLALCLEEKGRRNCDDWEEQSESKLSNNRNSRNPKRPN
ncbi:hypothetical protein B7P43_G04353 [Cryptotermes secundus]|uniref:Uncharacterized protein n=3 Tax=Cryptotermes secundus TaxID=105785 RepID=A0A2J7RE21_9NEOP|nr:hypothetical protein B7P43_G04353 [Cryptotermes secundus]